MIFIQFMTTLYVAICGDCYRQRPRLDCKISPSNLSNTDDWSRREKNFEQFRIASGLEKDEQLVYCNGSLELHTSTRGSTEGKDSSLFITGECCYRMGHCTVLPYSRNVSTSKQGEEVELGYSGFLESNRWGRRRLLQVQEKPNEFFSQNSKSTNQYLHNKRASEYHIY